MTQARRHLCLAQESRANVVSVGELRRQDLDRHTALQARVAPTKHDGHAAATDLALDVVRRRDGGG